MKRLFFLIAVLTLTLIGAEFPVFADNAGSAQERKGAPPAFSGHSSYPKSKKRPSPKQADSLDKGWGESGKAGEGSGNKAEHLLISNLVVVVNIDKTITLYNETADPKNSFDALGVKRLAIDYPYYQIGLAPQFSMTVVNKTRDYADFYADGNPYGKARENKSLPPDAYVGNAKIWSPYLWRDLRPGESRYIDGLSLSGYMKFHFISGGTDSSFMLMVH